MCASKPTRKTKRRTPELLNWEMGVKGGHQTPELAWRCKDNKTVK
jgi:hypothetical protein